MASGSVFQANARGTLVKGSGQEKSGSSSERLLWKAPLAVLDLALDLREKAFQS